MAKLLIPMIMLYALYVQFHGDFGPGGGFQAGVLFAVAIFLYALVFGLSAAQAVVTPRLIRFIAASGVLLYAGVGVASMFAGGGCHLLLYGLAYRRSGAFTVTNDYWVQPFVWDLVVCLLVGWIVALWTSPPEKSDVGKYF